MDKTLTEQEKKDLKSVLNREQDTVVILHGEKENRQLSFYADGTRLEARVGFPEE